MADDPQVKVSIHVQGLGYPAPELALVSIGELAFGAAVLIDQERGTREIDVAMAEDRIAKTVERAVEQAVSKALEQIGHRREKAMAAVREREQREREEAMVR